MKIEAQQVLWSEDKNNCQLITRYDNGLIASEPLTAEEAAEWEAKIRF